MSDPDELKKSLRNEIARYDDFLSKTKQYVDLVPLVLQRRGEAEAKITFLDHAPEDLLLEFTPMMLPLQRNDEMQSTFFTPALPNISNEAISYFSSTSGTSTVYTEAAYKAVDYYSEQGQNTDWFFPVATAFTGLAEMKSRSKYLPERLNKLQEELGEMFSIANSSVYKARGELITVNQAIMHMRDVLQQLWGGLAALAYQAHPEKYRGIQHKQLKKESHRDIIAQSLTYTEDEYKKFVLNLNSLAQLHAELSDTRIGKNPLSVDIPRMNGYYDRWIILIDDISGLAVKLSIVEEE